jgi:hypothetical protein
MGEPVPESQPLARHEVLPLGIVLERRRSDHPWQDHTWRPVDVIPGAPARDPRGEWVVLMEGEGCARYHSGTLPLELFRKETNAYMLNLAQTPPRLFIVLRAGDYAGTAHEIAPFVVTASPFEAQEYLESGDDLVETVAMPVEVMAFVQAFVDQHHVTEPFTKRKRKRFDAHAAATGAPPGPGGGRHD